MTTARCEGCGLEVEGGTQGCQELSDRLRILESEDFRYARFHRKAVDVYCLQHPDRYCVSAKSLAAHLTGLCWALEFGGSPSGLRALQRWLSSNPKLDKPELPSKRGDTTIADVLSAEADEYKSALDEWCRSVWAAYESLHELARRWIRGVMGE